MADRGPYGPSTDDRIRNNDPAYGFVKTDLYEYEKKASLIFSRDSEALLAERIGDSELAARLISTGFWEFIITQYAENHQDGASIKNTFGDSYLAYGTGARPISINISGYLLTTRDHDHRIDFIELYHRAFRGTMLRPQDPSAARLKLYLTVKDTIVAIWPINISIANTSQLSDMTQFSLAAYGYEYRVLRDRYKDYGLAVAGSSLGPISIDSNIPRITI